VCPSYIISEKGGQSYQENCRKPPSHSTARCHGSGRNKKIMTTRTGIVEKIKQKKVTKNRELSE
jgi:hypothetical protein